MAFRRLVHGFLTHERGPFGKMLLFSKREFGIRKPLKKLWEWNVFSTFKGENQQVT
jgi:hypothetical protein